MGKLNGLVPSQNGLHYSNDWPSVPDKKIGTPFGDIPIGDASKGLCEGMVFAVRDLFEARQLPPASYKRPGTNSPAFNFIVDRLFDSFNLPSGVAQYYEWMNLPRHDTLLGPHGLSWRTINDSMPRVRASINGGHPCPLGLVSVYTTDPTMLGHNHQVLAWGYDDQGSTTTVYIYDPDAPDRDDITITFDHTNPEHTTDFHYSTGTHTVFGFFPVDYTPHDPSPLYIDGSVTFEQPAPNSTLSGVVTLRARALGVGGIDFTAYYATNPADSHTLGWRELGRGRQGQCWGAGLRLGHAPYPRPGECRLGNG